MRFGLIADDLTGAGDSSSPFLAAGRVVISLWPKLPAPNDVCPVVSTESRDQDGGEARQRSFLVAQAMKAGGVDLLFRKIDSQVRGNVGADIAGTLRGWGGACVLALALPEEGRFTVGGWQQWAGGKVDLISMLRAAGLTAEVGSPADAAPGMVVVCNAQTSDELDLVAKQIANSTVTIIPAGTAALAARLPIAFGLEPTAPRDLPACARPVAVIGSPAAAKQAAYALSAGKTVIVLEPGQVPHDIDGFDGLFVSGGETASRMLRWLGVETLEVVGELLPRVPVAVCRGGPHDGMPFAMKSGAFGPVDAVARALDGLIRN